MNTEDILILYAKDQIVKTMRFNVRLLSLVAWRTSVLNILDQIEEDYVEDIVKRYTDNNAALTCS